MSTATHVDYERILLETHREDDGSELYSTASSFLAAHNGVVGPPPSRGMLEDNSFLYENNARGFHFDQTPGMAASRYLVDTPTHSRITSQNRSYQSPMPTLEQKKSSQGHHLSHGTASATMFAAPSSTATAAALEQIEMLNLDKKQLKQTITTLHKQLEHFHDVVGPDLDRFHSEQVKLREEVLRLREELRRSEDREQSSRARIKDLELALMKSEQGRRHGGDEGSSPEARLAQLQDAIAKAYVQRSALIREREAVVAMRDAIEWRQKALEISEETHERSDAAALSPSAPPPPGVISDAGGSLSHWRIRGKEADLDKNLQQKETLIASLTAAAREMEALLEDGHSRKHQDKLVQLNSRCPGCGKGQWSSPYCPTTGHPHAGFAKSNHGENCDVPLPRKVTITEALESGAWRKVVDVDTANVSFEEVGTGRIVDDLEMELDVQHNSAVQRAKEIAQKRQVPTLPQDAVLVTDAGAVKQAPGIDKEMRLLLTTLKERNEEIQKLKQLLQRMLDNGGLAALPQTAYPDAAPFPAAMPPLFELPQSASQSIEDTMGLLQETNAHLNQRCAEMACEGQAREQKIAHLTAEISRLRFGS